jgi:hypothetical protein
MPKIEPRGLRRAAAAAYLGISPSHFDKERATGAIPSPRVMFGVSLWDRRELDALFDGTPELTAANDNDPDYWDRECAAIRSQSM